MLVQVVIIAAMTDTLYSDLDQTFPALLLMLTLSSVALQSLGHIYAIVFGKYGIVVSILTIAWMVVFGGVFVTERDVSQFVTDTLISTDPVYNCIAHLVVLIYGFERCPEGSVSSMMYKFGYDDNDFDDSTLMLVYEIIILRTFSYLCLKLKVNWHHFEIWLRDVKVKLRIAK